MNDDTALREQLLEAEMQREMGEISDEEFAEIEARPAGPHPRDQGAPRGRIGAARVRRRRADRKHRRQPLPDRSERVRRFPRSRGRSSHHGRRNRASARRHPWNPERAYPVGARHRTDPCRNAESADASSARHPAAPQEPRSQPSPRNRVAARAQGEASSHLVDKHASEGG